MRELCCVIIGILIGQVGVIKFFDFIGTTLQHLVDVIKSLV